MVVGAPGELPKPPPEPIKFLEDMDDTELADAVGLMCLIHLSVLIQLQLGMPVGLTKCASTYMNIARHLTLYTQLGKYLLYERDYPGPACYSRATNRSLGVRHAIPSVKAMPDSRFSPAHVTQTLLHGRYASFIRRWHVQQAVSCPTPSSQCSELPSLSSRSATGLGIATHNKVLPLFHLVIYEAKMTQTRRSAGHS